MIEEVMRSGVLIGGPKIVQFKDQIGKISANASVDLFPSGRSAIVASLLALELPKGSGVVVQTYVCDAVTWAIRKAGLEPVLCDIGSGWTAGPVEVQGAINRNCSAILLTPPFGLLQSAEPFRKFGLPIVHDLCQASPAILSQVGAARFGDIIVTSFHPTKYVCAGGGGATIDPSGKYSRILRKISEECSIGSPFSELQAAIGVIQLGRLSGFEADRGKIFQRYIASAPSWSANFLTEAVDTRPGAMFRFPLRVRGVDLKESFSLLAEHGVIARQGVDQLAHRISHLDDARFPNAVSAFSETISFPFYPSLSLGEIEQVAQTMELFN